MTARFQLLLPFVVLLMVGCAGAPGPEATGIAAGKADDPRVVDPCSAYDGCLSDLCGPEPTGSDDEVVVAQIERSECVEMATRSTCTDRNGLLVLDSRCGGCRAEQLACYPDAT